MPRKGTGAPLRRLTGSAAGWLALGWLLSVAGCTSDQINPVGYPLVDTEFDVVLAPVLADSLLTYAALAIGDGDNPVTAYDVLYLGTEGETTSNILINYDFSDVFTEDFPDSIFTMDNIRSVDLRLIMLEKYKELDPVSPDPGAKALRKYYEIFETTAPFDSLAYPGPLPDYDPFNLVSGEYDAFAADLALPLAVSTFMGWLETGGQVGVMVAEYPTSDPGFMGFSSRDMRYGGSSLIDYNADKVIAPALMVQFHALPDTNLNPQDVKFFLRPYADTSSFHEVAQPPASAADGLMMRTCLRNYPTLHFDFSQIPDNAIINRATLVVYNDTTTSFGVVKESIIISEMDTTLYTSPVDTISMTILENYAYEISGMTNVDQYLEKHLEFNVTTGVQRIVNEVYTGVRGFTLTAAEDFFPTFKLRPMDPDFYYSQFNFFGTADPDLLKRPRMKITYSLVGAINEGEQP